MVEDGVQHKHCRKPVPVIAGNSIRLASEVESGDALVDERCLQPDLVGADRIVPVASVVAGRDLDASSSTQRAAT
jgi:hypothetical protein